jgi:hypothetical protein
MAKTEQELIHIAKVVADEVFAAATAHSDKHELKAAVQALDNGMGAATDTIQSVHPGKVLKVAIRDHIQTTEPDLTNQEAGVILAYWALHEVGLL